MYLLEIKIFGLFILFIFGIYLLIKVFVHKYVKYKNLKDVEKQITYLFNLLTKVDLNEKLILYDNMVYGIYGIKAIPYKGGFTIVVILKNSFGEYFLNVETFTSIIKELKSYRTQYVSLKNQLLFFKKQIKTIEL